MKQKILVLLVISTFIFSGCSKETLTFEWYKISTDSEAQKVSQEVGNILQQRDFVRLAEITSEKWLFFGRYNRFEETDPVFASPQIAGFAQDESIYRWWVYDGSWENIDLNISQYFEKFVWNRNFLEYDAFYFNQFTQHGNMINNLFETFPDAQIVELFLEWENEMYGGLDWNSLYFIFEKQNSGYFLRGIVHSSWTT